MLIGTIGFNDLTPIHPGRSAPPLPRRELREEVGYDAQELEAMSTYFTSKSILLLYQRGINV